MVIGGSGGGEGRHVILAPWILPAHLHNCNHGLSSRGVRYCFPPPSLGSCFPLICIGRLQQHQDAAPYSVHLIIYGTNLHKYAPLDLHRVSFPRRRRRRRWEVEGGREGKSHFRSCQTPGWAATLPPRQFHTFKNNKSRIE